MNSTDIERVLISEDELKQIVKNVADSINAEFRGKELYVICIMKGSLVFTADLIRQLDCDVTIDYMQASSYGGGVNSSGSIIVKRDIEGSVEGKNVLIVEDIVDSGNTLHKLQELFETRKASCVKLCTLLDKPSRREVEIKVDYVGKQIPDEFIIGYGLDYDQHYRNLPFIGVLSKSVYEK